MPAHDFTATLHDGIVIEVDDARHALRVRIPALEDMPTDWLPMITLNAGGNRFYALPDEGELVKCLLDARGESGVVLGAIYSEADPTPASSRDIWCKEFTNGTRIEHDRRTGQVTVETTGKVLVEASEVTIDAPQTTCTGKLTVVGLLTYQGGMAGSGGTGAAAKIQGSIEASDDVKAGNISLASHDHTEGVGNPA